VIMAGELFDPYHKWLGIPREEQPPHYYRLLGISLFEADADVIETAADQRMAHLRTFQSGKNGQLSQKLLNELAAAKIALLQPAKKAEYDQELRAKLGQEQQPGAANKAAKPPARALPKAQPLGEGPLAAPAALPQVMPIKPQPTPVKPQSSASLPGVHPAVIGGIAAAAAILILGMGALAYFALAGGNGTTVASGGSGKLPSPADPTLDRSGLAIPRPDPSTDSNLPPEAQPMPVTNQPPVPDPRPVTPTPVDPVVPETEPPTTPEPRQLEPVVDTPGETPPAEPPPDPMPEEERPKLPPAPSETDVVAATKTIKELFQKEYSATRPEDKRALAKKLLEQAEETASDPVAQFALLQEARRLAMSAADYETGSAAIDAAATSFDIDPFGLKAESLQAIAKMAKLPEHHQKIADAALALLEPAAEAEQFDAAKSLAAVAGASARRARNVELVKQIEQQSKHIETQRKAFEGLEAARATLARDPHDAAANLAVGNFLCLTQGDWSRGLAHLAKGSDEKLRQLALRDLAALDPAKPASTDDQLKLGDDWWAYGETERKFRGRAAYWYDQALPTLSGLNKVRIEKRLDEIAAAKLDGGVGLGSLAASAVVLLTFEESTVIQGGAFALQDLSPKKSVFNGKAKLVPGVAGTAAYFSGPNDRVWGGADIPHANQPRTYSLWIKSENAAADARYTFNGGTADGGRFLMWAFAAARGVYVIDLYNFHVTSKVPVDTRWHHHCGVYDGKDLVYLIDGVVVGTNTYDLATSPGLVSFGGSPVTIDEVAVFNRALTEKEVARLYQMGKSRRVLKEVK
jgi:hypothetical protein